HTPKARRVNSGPSPIFTRRSYEPAPSPGQLRVGEDLPAALGVFTQLGAVFGARRQRGPSEETDASRRRRASSGTAITSCTRSSSRKRRAHARCTPTAL